jgi:RHS repeat-associated protein
VVQARTVPHRQTPRADDLNAAYTRDYAYDDLDRLTWDSKVSAANPSYTYDANGNRLTRTAGTYPAQSFSYMANSNRETNTSYDGMGNSSSNLARTELTRPDACTNAVFTIAIDDFVFTPDGHALHVRTANTAAVSVDYLWLDDLPVAQFQDSYDAQGVYIGTEATYLHSDHLGTPRIGTNAGKQITWRNRSDAFGIAALSGSAVVRLRFPGQLSLGVAGLNYNYYRDYDPKVGRYVESDPIGLAGGQNTYLYGMGNPLRFVDPRGLDATLPYDPQYRPTPANCSQYGSSGLLRRICEGTPDNPNMNCARRCIAQFWPGTWGGPPQDYLFYILPQHPICWWECRLTPNDFSCSN